MLLSCYSLLTASINFNVQEILGISQVLISLNVVGAGLTNRSPHISHPLRYFVGASIDCHCRTIVKYHRLRKTIFLFTSETSSFVHRQTLVELLDFGP